MDDADGGRRGLRARPGPGLRRALRDHWGLRGFGEAVDLGGSSSLNLVVGEADRRTWYESTDLMSPLCGL